MKKKKRIKVSSAKAKGRNLQKWVCEKISKLTGIEWGQDKLIASRPMGQSGSDVILMGEAAEQFPFCIECKNQESWSVPSWIKQAQEIRDRDNPDRVWLLIAKRKGIKPVVIMDADEFFEMADLNNWAKS